MTRFIVGLDVSKGYVDCWVLGSEGQVGALVRFDETTTGHQSFWRVLDELADEADEIHVGMESTGGLERRWRTSVKQWRKKHCPPDTVTISTHVLDPRAVKHTAQSMATRCKTDSSSAEAIARHLAGNGSVAKPERSADEEALAGHLRSLLAIEKQKRESVNMIKSLLPQANPVMVAHLSQQGLPAWGLDVLTRYPTADHLARAKSNTLSSINHVSKEKADSLISKAAEVVGCMETRVYEDQMLLLLESYKSQLKLIEKQWDRMLARVADHPECERLQTIPGVGPKTSCAIIIELVSLTRFKSGDAVVSFCGLDPVFDQSGDKVIQRGISHQGPPHLRALLFTAAQSASSHNPIIKAFYQRLLARGKTPKLALTACMAKLLRIMYACVMTEKDFDVSIHEAHCQKAAPQDHRSTQPLGRPETAQPSTDTQAPVSHAERRRRREEQKNRQKQTSAAQTDQAAEKPSVAATKVNTEQGQAAEKPSVTQRKRATKKPRAPKTKPQKATGGRHHARS